jgi:hypothetical protein
VIAAVTLAYFGTETHRSYWPPDARFQTDNDPGHATPTYPPRLPKLSDAPLPARPYGQDVAIRSLNVERSTVDGDDEVRVRAEVVPDGRRAIRVVAQLWHDRKGPGQELGEQVFAPAGDERPIGQPATFQCTAKLRSKPGYGGEPTGVDVFVFGENGDVLVRRHASLGWHARP